MLRRLFAGRVIGLLFPSRAGSGKGQPHGPIVAWLSVSLIMRPAKFKKTGGVADGIFRLILRDYRLVNCYGPFSEDSSRSSMSRRTRIVSLLVTFGCVASVYGQDANQGAKPNAARVVDIP